jgi:hypothetical protein
MYSTLDSLQSWYPVWFCPLSNLFRFFAYFCDGLRRT